MLHIADLNPENFIWNLYKECALSQNSHTSYSKGWFINILLLGIGPVPLRSVWGGAHNTANSYVTISDHMGPALANIPKRLYVSI